MITVENGIFHLKTRNYSYLFRVNEQKILEHLHFGAPVLTEDAAAFACKPGLGWGTSIQLAEGDPKSCLNALALEWSGSGRGDFREAPLELCDAATDFRFESSRIVTGSLPMKSGLPQAQEGSHTLEVVLAQKDIKLHLFYTTFDTVLVRRAVLENCGVKPLAVNKLMSFSVDLPGSYEMTSFHGAWDAEMRLHRQPVTGGKVINETTMGCSSNAHQPGFLLSEPDAGENYGVVYGFNLIYSANHYASAQKSHQGLTRVMQGINPANFRKTLAPGECFETPEAVLCWSDEGFGGVSQRFHDFVNRHIVPKAWQFRPRPVLYNDWEGCMFDFNQARLVDLAKRAKKLGCELFVLDDGWFGERNHDKAGLGDYNVNKKKLPSGMKGLADKITELGMTFGLWFEPEAVNPDSDLYRAHPDWALTDQFDPLYCRNELLLDLTKPEVRDYIVESVTTVLDSAKISYVKWDMNRPSVAVGVKAHDYILGLYDVMRRIFGPRPEILLEGCSSGGNRFDLGMLCFAPQIWCSDNTDPIERLVIQENLSYLYPQSTFGAHVSAAPHSQTLRNTPLTTRGNVSFFGCLGYELDLKHLLPVEETEIKAQVAFYKEYREVFQYGAFRRLSDKEKTVWQVSSERLHIAGLFHKLVHAAPGYERLKLTGLKKDRRYHVTTREQSIRIGPFGALIKHVAPVELNPNGVVLRTADRHMTMPDGQEDFIASGSALQTGVMLKPLFGGTGYNTEQRTQGDFGSNVYIVKEEPLHEGSK